MVEAVCNPRPKLGDSEKDALLAELVKLRVTIKKSSRNELIHNTYRKGGENSEDDVEEGQRPGFVNDLARKGILERILDGCEQDSILEERREGGKTYPELRHVEGDVLVK